MEDITFDILTGQVNVNGKQQRLTKTEARLFWELYRHAGTVIDYDTLITRVWGEGYLSVEGASG